MKAEPFPTPDAAWMWTMAALRSPDMVSSGVRRPCEPEDVVRALDGLYRRRRIDLVHARILRIWGEQQIAPDGHRPEERADWRLWREAMERLEWPLRVKGIVA